MAHPNPYISSVYAHFTVPRDGGGASVRIEHVPQSQELPTPPDDPLPCMIIPSDPSELIPGPGFPGPNIGLMFFPYPPDPTQISFRPVAPGTVRLMPPASQPWWMYLTKHDGWVPGDFFQEDLVFKALRGYRKTPQWPVPPLTPEEVYGDVVLAAVDAATPG